MTLRRGGTPLMGGGVNIPTLEASNQSQIDDLVQRNRTLEHTNKKLSEQLSQEHSRSKDTILQLQSQWDINQSHWKQTCESLLGSYRITQKHVQVELEKERMNTLKEMKFTRDEKLLRLQRDFKITLFQMKEEELERRVGDVEVEKTMVMHTNGLVVQKMQEKCAEYVIKLRDTQALLSQAAKETEERETKLNKLVEGRANLEASSESIKSKLERTKLQLDGAQSKNLDLERSNDELKRTNAELTRQLEKWQSLETKEGEAADTERKQRIALEMELREVTESFEKKLAKAGADVERANARVEKVKCTVKEWEGAFDDARMESENFQKQLAKAMKRIEKLKSELEVERAKVPPPSPQKNDKISTPPQREDTPVEDDDPIEIEATPPPSPPPPPRKTRAKPSSAKPSSSSKQTTTETVPLIKPNSVESPPPPQQQQHPQIRIARKSTGGKPPRPPKKLSTSTVDDDSDIEEISDPNRKKGKAKATESDKDEDQVRTAAASATASRKTGKRKTSDNDDVVEQPKRQKTNTGRAGSEIRETTARTRTKRSGSRATSRQFIAAKPSEEKDDNAGEGGADVTLKNPKKRKINIFPTGNSAIQFSFGSMSNLNGDKLNIPTTLSPLKEDEPIPSRSLSSMVQRRR